MDKYRENMDKLIEKTRKIAWEWYEKYDVPVKDSMRELWQIIAGSGNYYIYPKMFFSEHVRPVKIKLYKNKMTAELRNYVYLGLIKKSQGDLKFEINEDNILITRCRMPEFYISKGFDDFVNEKGEYLNMITNTKTKLIDLVRGLYSFSDRVSNLTREIIDHLIKEYWPEEYGKILLVKNYGKLFFIREDLLMKSHILTKLPNHFAPMYSDGKRYCEKCPYYPECLRMGTGPADYKHTNWHCRMRIKENALRITNYLFMKKIYERKYKKEEK